MTKDSFEEALEKLIPKNLDDVVRKNRENFRLALATKKELAKLESNVTEASVKCTLKNWQVIMLHATLEDGAKIASPRLVGSVVETGESWSTSHVISMDTDKSLVKTRNSLYRVVGSRVREDKLDLLHICIALHQMGLGGYLGVPVFFY